MQHVSLSLLVIVAFRYSVEQREAISPTHVITSQVITHVDNKVNAKCTKTLIRHSIWRITNQLFH